MAGFMSTDFVELVLDMLVGDKECHTKRFDKCVVEMKEYRIIQLEAFESVKEIIFFEYDVESDFSMTPSGIVSIR
jgi:hypothetical protein